jgi:four helix bundle protein
LATISSFEEIRSWQASREFNKRIYQITNDSHYFKNDFELKNQVRKSSISISSNIAEGFERETPKEFIRFLYIAKGSAGECRSQLFLAHDLEYLTEKEFDELISMATEISKLIGAFIKYLRSTLKPSTI